MGKLGMVPCKLYLVSGVIVQPFLTSLFILNRMSSAINIDRKVCRVSVMDLLTVIADVLCR